MNQPKKRRGRPIGGKAPAEVRKYWRVLQQDYRRKMGTNAKKDLSQARRKPH